MKIKDGLLVLIITACSYLYTYGYFLGYFRAKNIPDQFIDIQLISMIKVGVFLLGVLGLMSFFIDMLTAIGEREVNEGQTDALTLSEPWRLFLKRNSLIIITMLLAIMDFFHNPTISKLSFIVFVFCFVFLAEFSVVPKNVNTKWYMRRFNIYLKSPRVTGSIKAAHKLNVLTQFVYLTWGMSALLLMYFIGVTVANGENDTLMCNGKYHALQINSDAVLVTRDYREFKFIEKTECSFTNLK